MRRLLTYILLFFALSAAAITQQGFVRTISRPNAPGERLEGVLIRVRGNHNMVLTEQSGDFALLLTNVQNGDPYVLSAVMKSGYQLAEEDLIGRQQAGSDRVPLEVTMISLAQLQADKNAIAAKARAGVEKYYMEQLAALGKALSEQRFNAEQYEQQIAALDDKLMHSEEQIQKMADRYARTDYAQLDSVAGAIQTAIEQGDLDAAEQMILRKGSLRDRQQRILDMQRDLAAQTRDLKQDYYHLHSIALSRFQPDSAAYYLRLRADLDSTDAAAMLDYAQFLNEYGRNHALDAYQYIQRADRQIHRTGCEHSSLMLRVLNEKGSFQSQSGLYSDAVDTYNDAVRLSKEIYGGDSHLTAGRLVSLGASYCNLKQYDEAIKHLNEAMRIYHIPGEEHPISEATLLNTMAGIAFAQKDYALARDYLEQALTILQKVAPNDNSLPRILFNIAVAYKFLNEEQVAADYYQRAYEAAVRILGEKNHFTKYIRTKIQ